MLVSCVCVCVCGGVVCEQESGIKADVNNKGPPAPLDKEQAVQTYQEVSESKRYELFTFNSILTVSMPFSVPISIIKIDIFVCCFSS